MPEHTGKSYQAAHQYDRAELAKRSSVGMPPEQYEQIIEMAIRHVPCRSNDVLLERWIEELIQLVPDDLKARLKKMFVAKLRDFEANAAAICDASCDGDLIFFNVGLSDACYQYAIVYYEFVRVFGDQFAPDDTGRIVRLKAELYDHLAQLAIAQKRWDRLGVVEFEVKDVVNSSLEIEGHPANIAGLADKFILRHEISHHLLGHTETGAQLLSYVDNLPEHCKYWKTVVQKAHQQEYEADASALTMTLQTQSLDVVTRRQREFDVVVGALLTLTVLGQLVREVNEATPSHPSVSSRFDQCVEILRSVCQHEIRALVYLMKQFQVLLWSTQGKGLGHRWSGAKIRL